jgi:hypothetical protein
MLALLLAVVAVRAEPARLVLGPKARAAIEIVAPPGARVSLWTSTGTIGAPSAVAPGRYRAEYTPPPFSFPQVAIVLATVEKDGAVERGWLALPLVGALELDLDTKPLAQVEVHIGRSRYGPVRADRRGRVHIAVQVPPGVRAASVYVRDRPGNVNSREIDLSPPPFPRLKLVASRESASWADPSPVVVEVFAVSPEGRPIAASELHLSAQRGSFDGLRELSPGAFSALYQPPSHFGGAVSDTLRATIPGAALPEVGVLTVALEPGPPARVDVRAAPGEATAGTRSEISIHAAVVDARGNPLPSGSIEMEADFGELRRTGPADATLSIPAVFDGRSQVRVKASGRGVDGEGLVALRAEEPGRARIEVAQALVPPPRKAWTPSVGLLAAGRSNFGRALSGGAVLETDLSLPWAPFELVARMEFAQYAPARAPYAAGGTGVFQTASLRSFGAASGARAALPLSRQVMANATLLAGLARSSGTLGIEGGAAGGTSQRAGAWGATLALACGATLNLGRGRLLAEGSWTFAPAGGAVSGNLGGLGFAAGYLIDLR